MDLLPSGITAQAHARPGAVAVVAGDEALTYGELESLSDRLAWMLLDRGCLPGDRVAFLLPKSPSAIVAMLGILKAGAVYVPMDTASPPARLALIAGAAAPSWLLTTAAGDPTVEQLLTAVGPGSTMQVGWLDHRSDHQGSRVGAFDLAEIRSCPDGPPPPLRAPDGTAHILFTSGSTGHPKGVVITHAMVLAFLRWAVPHFGIDETDRNSGHSPLHFDLSTFDVFGTLRAGAQLHLVPAELRLSGTGLTDWIRSSALTQWFSVPSVLGYVHRLDGLRRGDLPALRRVMWCGEVLPTPSLIYWMERLPHVTFTNLYGPTEATIASSHHTVGMVPSSITEPIPIGRACDGEELLVLDAERRPVPDGTVGDLHIAGSGLSPGYWRAPELTASAFGTLPGSPGQRIYRTGDLASRSADGLHWFHGRSDSQIKSRGYRIELGEVETALHAVEGLRDCAVVAVRSDSFEGWSICGAYVLHDGTELTPATIRRALGRAIPGYMVPTRWLALPALPLNDNGKVDRPALRARFETLS